VCDVLSDSATLGDFDCPHAAEEWVEMLRPGVEERLKRSSAITHRTVIDIHLANLLVGNTLITSQSGGSDAREEFVAQALGFLDQASLGGLPALAAALMPNDVEIGTVGTAIEVVRNFYAPFSSPATV